jgi:hypothetical protein
MKRFHLVLGIVLVIVFLLTGQYMEYVHNRTSPDTTRLLYRSRHIYLLFNAMINISLGLYVLYCPAGWRRLLQVAGSILIMLAPVLLLAGFLYEAPRGIEHTFIARYGIFATAIGILFHLVSASRKGSV